MARGTYVLRAVRGESTLGESVEFSVRDGQVVNGVDVSIAATP